MANLVELFDNIVQMQNLNGVPLAAGKLYVYALGRTRLMDSWSDVDGESLNPNPIILDDAGQAHVYVSDDFDYTIVVCDQYNNEIFSLDKYLYSEGSHSHADVAVAPSESIAVSSYHVGETTVYVPYLTGQLGKVYEGIDPIVVNNQVDKISANHVPLGVQDPLYFVQDDEEGCIIGFSGEALPEGTMNESAFGYEDGKITGYNGSGFSAGLNYEAGSYVDIDGNTINVTGLQPAGNYQSAGDYVVHDELSSYATQDWVENQSYMKEYMESAFYPSTSNPSGYLTEHQDLSDYAKTEDLTAYQEKGNYYSASNPDGFINSDAISAMATTGFVADVSGDITGLIPSTAGLATENWVTSQGYLTEHQSLDGLMSANLLEISDNKITGYNGTAFAGQGGGVTGDFELSAGSGISIVDYPLEQKTVISVTAQGGNPEVEQAVIDNSATWDSVTAKQDALNFGYHDTAISSIDNSTLYDNSAHARITTLAGRISDLSSNKLDTTAFSDVSGTFLTAHQDISNKLDTTAFSDVSGSFLTAVPDTYLQNTDLSTEDGKVTAISGIPLSAGGGVPEGVMVESGLEYNAVNEISGYNGSAIAQYGAEKQFIVHDDTLVHLSNSAQYALGVQVPNVAKLMGVDETVLWSGSANTGTLNLSEPLTSFKEFKFYVYIPERGTNQVLTYYDAVNTVNPGFFQLTMSTMTTGSVISAWWQGIYNINGTVDTATYKSFSIYANGQYYKQCSTTACGTNDSRMVIKKIIGIGKKV